MRSKPSPEPKPGRKPDPAAQPRPRMAGFRRCRTGLWNGYIKKQFYAEPVGGGPWIARSSYFRLEQGRSIEHSEQARQAFMELLDQLVSAGWEITGRRSGAWEVELRQPARSARPASAPPRTLT